jgi:hypothetical protein
VDYKLITNELWMDNTIVDRNSCEWISFIIWSCSMLVFVTYFHFGTFTTSFNLVIFWVWWVFMRLFCPIWLYKWFWFSFEVCGHIVSWSCSPICIMFVYGIMIGETNQQHSTWCNWKGDLLVGHLHICHLL